MLRGTIWNALRVALGIFSGIVFMICCSETPAGVSEQLFHGKGRKGERVRRRYPFRQSLRLCHLPQGDGFRGGGRLSGIAKSRPLGEGGCERSEQTEGVSPGRGCCPYNVFLIYFTCLCIGKTGEKCLHLGGFDDKITLLEYAQNRGVIGK